MGRHTEAVCRLCRREGLKLFLKGDRCFKEKCALERRGYPPGQHGRRRTKVQSYGIQLREKQKVKRYYGLLEKQFVHYFRKAGSKKGNTGEVLLELLERRLDNVVYKLNFASSRKSARQLISHGHIYVNGRRVDIPDMLLKIGDKLTLKKSDRSRKLVKEQLASNPNYVTQGWLQLDADKPAATVVALPSRSDVQLVIEEQLVVEFCSR